MYIRAVTLVLVIASLFLIAVQQVATKTLSIIDSPVTLFDDSDFNGGGSASELSSSDSAITANCQLDTQYAWPYCELEFDIRDTKGRGRDISGMDEVIIELDASYNSQPLVDQALRLHAKNFDRTLPEGAHIKTNHIEFNAQQQSATFHLPLAYMQVADWWKKDNNIPLEQSFSDVSNVTHISIVTPSNAIAGNYQITIQSLSVVGPWIASQHLYLALLCIWIAAAALYLIVSFTATRQKVTHLTVRNSELIENSQRIQTLASIDTLTGALNRRGGIELIERLELSQFGILYIDLDHFKQLNDRFGHDVGDRVLSRFSEMVQSIATEDSHFIRWGGEEFLLIIEDTNNEDCINTAKAIQNRMLQKERFDQHEVTCSIGIAINTDRQAFKQVLQDADRALYIAKNRGRNCIQAA